MPTPELVPADGDPPEDPAAAAEPAPARRDQPVRADAPRTEHPLPESSPSTGAAGADA